MGISSYLPVLCRPYGAEEELREQLRKAYRRLLNPLVRILIRNGLTAPWTGELLRQVFVDAATSEDLQLPGRRLSDTRVAILTGLSRKEVHRLRNESDANKAGTEFESCWASDRRVEPRPGIYWTVPVPTRNPV